MQPPYFIMKAPFSIGIAIENGPFKSLIYLLKMEIFHSLYVYQRVNQYPIPAA